MEKVFAMTSTRAALETIATFPITDIRGNIDAVNMQNIALSALSSAPAADVTIPGADDMAARFAWIEAKASDMGYMLVPQPEHPDSPPAPADNTALREAENEIGGLREKLSDALAGGVQHKSDCSVYSAPAYTPSQCNCGAAVSIRKALELAERTLRGLAKDCESAAWVDDEDFPGGPSVLTRIRQALSASGSPGADVERRTVTFLKRKPRPFEIHDDGADMRQYDRRETAWLVERNGTYASTPGRHPGWSADPWRAHRYESRAAAQDAILDINSDELRDSSQPIEHMFIYDRPDVGQNSSDGGGKSASAECPQDRSCERTSSDDSAASGQAIPDVAVGPSDPATPQGQEAALSATFDALVALQEAVKQSGTMNGREYIDLGIQVSSALDKAKAALSSPSWRCAAREQGSAGGNDPADCDWPVCGCDPAADKVVAALQESGVLRTRAPDATEATQAWVNCKPIEKLMEFVERTAKQKTTDEFEDHEREGADYEGAYDIVVMEARVIVDAVNLRCCAPPPAKPSVEDIARVIEPIHTSEDVLRRAKRIHALIHGAGGMEDRS